MATQVNPKQLERTVRELKARAIAHRDYIQGHETRTRVLLIDPLLRALGWDPENPDEVQLEYRLMAGQPDYALMKDGKPVAVIEAKKLGSSLDQRSPGQVIKYTAGQNFSHGQMVAFTNGVLWVFFRASNSWDPQSVDLAAEETFETAYNLVDCVSESAFDVPITIPGPGPFKPDPSKTGRPTIVDPPPPTNWIPLPDADPNRKPARISFEGGPMVAVTSWGKVYLESARYVVDRDLVRPNDYPVVLARRETVKKCAMHTTPIHPHGVRFYNRVVVRDGIWLDNGLGSNSSRKEYSIRMLKRFGIDPNTVHVEYAQPPADESLKSPPRP